MKGNHMRCAVVAACLLLAAAVIAEARNRDQKHFGKLYYDYLVPDTDLYYASCRVCHINVPLTDTSADDSNPDRLRPLTPVVPRRNRT